MSSENFLTTPEMARKAKYEHDKSSKLREQIASVLWPNWRNLDSYCQAKVFEDVARILTCLKTEIEKIENPYPETVFPTTIPEAGKLLTDTGLTDKEITAISGCIARLGWANYKRQVLEAIEELE